MSETKTQVDNEVIESFLQGNHPQKYIVAIESYYDKPKVTLVINDRDNDKKYLEDDSYKPFLWFKTDVTKLIYGGKKLKISEAATKHGVKIKKLRTSNDEGYSPARMENGYVFLATCSKSYNELVNFFKFGGVDVFKKEFSKMFVMFSPTEQYLIQTGKRLFKGMDDYDDVHRLQFDLETEGLFATKNAIFQIGIRDNKGFEGVLETVGTGVAKRNSEKENIEKFFQVIDAIQPDMITGYNSENFDWPFLFERAERLGIPITELAITLNRISKIKRKPASLKLGGETEVYQQTHMFGYNIMDISHAVRRAMAINSEIKSWGLKYITQYSEIAKPNRVYVPGDKINPTWSDKVNDYAFNNTNGDWYKITDKAELKEGYKKVKGDYIVQRYLCDDLWETEQIDNIFNQASFLIAKMLPTTFMRSSTMGTAGQWKLIMAAWSYENGLAIPETQSKRDFTGGLSRLLEVGYAKNVVKLDYAALYPKTQLTHGIFPDLDISGVMQGMLTYVVDKRDEFKFLTGIEKKKAYKLADQLKNDSANMTDEEKAELKKLINEHKALANVYDKKQLPLKILANSWFGSYGAPYIFNWGDSDSAEETTCRGRQYLRLMVRHFAETHGFRPLVGDTDGFNFSFPDNVNDVKYVAKGTHWKTTHDKDKELCGLDAVLAEFNENYMEGRMGLDIDDICNSTINFARKNYANDIGGKIKLVGNSVKSKKMSVYIEEFLGKAIRMLLDGDGYSFINYYHEYVDKIYNYQIPLVKIATKARVKCSIDEYKKKATMKNKAGNPLPKQAHMELVMKNNIDISLGDTIYYVNTGLAKSTGDLKTVVASKMTKKAMAEYIETHGKAPDWERRIELNCKLIQPEVIERDFELIKELEMMKKSITVLEADDIENITSLKERILEIEETLSTDEYNVARYLDNFNKKVKPLLVCFNEDVRSRVLLDIVKVKDKDTKQVTEKLKERVIFTKAECELISGIPFKEIDQDSYQELMTMEDKEIKFWDKVNKVPNNMEESEWIEVRADYHERMRIAKLKGIQFEKDTLDDIFKHLEVSDFDALLEGDLPIDIFTIGDLSDDGTAQIISRKWDEPLCSFDDIFKYEPLARKRNEYYLLAGNDSVDNRYEEWLNYIAERKFLSGETVTMIFEDDEMKDFDTMIEAIRNKPKKGTRKPKVVKEVAVVKPKVESEDDEEIGENVFAIGKDGELIRTDEILQLDDEVDDTFGEVPDDYVPFIGKTYNQKEQFILDNGFIDYHEDGWVRESWLIDNKFSNDMIVNTKRAYDMINNNYGLNSWLEEKPQEENKQEEPDDEWGF